MLPNSNRKRRYQDAQRDKLIKIQLSACRNKTAEDLTHSDEPDKGREANLQTEFDEYGAELHRDARVWKVYVDEADKYDKELVDGWNTSMDVLLIFAALFSAISTAFLIESSKMLQSDPAEVSARTLGAISRSLDSIVNGTQQPGSLIQSSDNAAEFTPSPVAISINVLWYLSLSLSLATSFISILAKDWCHSFITGRTGHPYSQMYHRQRKWNMIERWRMPEFLSMLPALLHLALLCFSVGLCLYLWETHLAVAIPVIFITGTTIVFYVLSSAVAIILDYFPYTTIISRTCRSKPAQRLFEFLYSLAARLVAYPLVQLVYSLVLLCVNLGVLVLQYCVLLLVLLCSLVVALVGIPLNLCDQLANHSPLLVQLVAVPVLSILRLFIYNPASIGASWFVKLLDYCRKTYNWISFHGPQGSDITNWKQPRTKPKTQDQSNHNARDDAVVSLALSWLITNCEAPDSIETALQSIAGATQGIPRQPLLDCGATLEILRRLASAKLYKDSGAKAHEVVSRYSRALTYLGGPADFGSDAVQNRQGDELEGVIWDLHLTAEKRAAALIVDGSFRLTQTNINAFRLGNTAAPSVLGLLKKGSNHKTTQFDETIDSISELLRLYLSDNDNLHNSALLSLVNAAALLYLFAPRLPGSLDLPLSLVKLADSTHHSSTPHGKLTITLGIICALSRSRIINQEGVLEPADRSWLEGSVRALVEMNSQSELGLDLVMSFGLQALALHQEADHPDDTASQIREVLGQQATSRVNAFFDGFTAAVPFIPSTDIQEDTISSYLQAFDSTCNLRPFGTASSCISFFALTYLCARTGINNFVEDYVAPTQARWPFPRLSSMLTWMIEERKIIPLLEEKSNSQHWAENFMATGQLWLLFALYRYSADGTPDDREKLGIQLRKYREINALEPEVQHRELGEQLVRHWKSRRIYYSNPGGWECRLMECVFQSQNAQVPSSVHEHIQNTPQHLRGLSSFTAWVPQSQQPEATGGLTAEPEVQDLRITHTSTDGIDPAPQVVSATNSNDPEIGAEAAEEESEGANKRIDPDEDNGALHGRTETGSSGQEIPLEQQETTKEGTLRARDGQEEASQNRVTSTRGVDPANAGRTESAGPYTAIDMQSPRDVPE